MEEGSIHRPHPDPAYQAMTHMATMAVPMIEITIDVATPSRALPRSTQRANAPKPQATSIASGSSSAASARSTELRNHRSASSSSSARASMPQVPMPTKRRPPSSTACSPPPGSAPRR